MAGRGLRFRHSGILTPKPLIPVDGVPMVLHAIESLDSLPLPWTLTYIVREDFEEADVLDAIIRSRVPTARAVLCRGGSRGAVETCMAAMSEIDPASSLLVVDCDIRFSSDYFFPAIHDAVVNESTDALLLSFRSEDARFSFAEVDTNNLVIRTAEKTAISDHALIGAYFFRRGADFIMAAQELMTKPISDHMQEFYLSLLFNIIISRGMKVHLTEGEFTSFGTPEELKAYENRGGRVRSK